MSQIKSVFRQKHRIARYLVVAVKQICAHLRAVSSGRHKDIGVVLALLVHRCHNVSVRCAKIIGTVLPCIAQDPITIGRIIEWTWRRYHTVHPFAFVGDVDNLARMYKPPVLCSASEEFLGKAVIILIMFDKCLDCAGISNIEGCRLFHHHFISCPDFHLCRVFVEFDNRTAIFRFDRKCVALIRHLRVRFCVVIRIIRLSRDLSLIWIAVSDFRIFAELAGRIHIITEDAVFQKGNTSGHSSAIKSNRRNIAVNGHIVHRCQASDKRIRRFRRSRRSICKSGNEHGSCQKPCPRFSELFHSFSFPFANQM